MTSDVMLVILVKYHHNILKFDILPDLLSTMLELPNGSVSSMIAFIIANLCFGSKSIWS